MYLGFMINYNQGLPISTGFGVASDAYVAVGVSGSALLTLSVISTTLCCLPGIFQPPQTIGRHGLRRHKFIGTVCCVPRIYRHKFGKARRSGRESYARVEERERGYTPI